MDHSRVRRLRAPGLCGVFFAPSDCHHVRRHLESVAKNRAVKSMVNRSFDIRGPNPTPAEANYIDGEYSELERLQQKELQRKQIEAERESEAKRLEGQRQAEFARMAYSQLQTRQRIALRKIEVSGKSIECRFPPGCRSYKVTIGVRNQSIETISTLSFGWAFLPKTDKCPTSTPIKHRENVRLVPNGTTAINIDGWDGPSSDETQIWQICIGVVGVEIVP